jgi:hypothetical protein
MDYKNDPLNFEFWSSFNNQLSKESDRGVALVAASSLDVLLKRLILNSIIDDQKIKKKLFSGPGAALSSLYNKTNLAMGMGLISSEDFHDLTIIREIRNKFAHSIHELNFDEKGIKKQVRELQIPKMSNYDDGETEKDSKDIFRIGASMLATFLYMRANKKCEKVTPAERYIISDESMYY